MVKIMRISTDKVPDLRIVSPTYKPNLNEHIIVGYILNVPIRMVSKNLTQEDFNKIC